MNLLVGLKQDTQGAGIFVPTAQRPDHVGRGDTDPYSCS